MEIKLSMQRAPVASTSLLLLLCLFSGIAQACQDIGIQLSSDNVNELVAPELGSHFPSKVEVGCIQKM